jgi:predicted amidophosphoribosyltransferase
LAQTRADAPATLAAVATTLLDLLLPQRCVVCRTPGIQLCVACTAALPRVRAPLCERCGAPTAWPVRRCRECAGRRLAFTQARAAVVYDEGVRALVRLWKERGLRRLAAALAGIVAEALPRPHAAAVTFVPPDGERSLERGHHPAERLAVELAGRWEVPSGRLLERAKRIERQTGLRLADRRRNVRGAFAAVGRSPPTVVLVDDVYTSGATVAAAASALRRSGTRRVEVVTFARAVR